VLFGKRSGTNVKIYGEDLKGQLAFGHHLTWFLSQGISGR
jgi:hypothetical protein